MTQDKYDKLKQLLNNFTNECRDIGFNVYGATIGKSIELEIKPKQECHYEGVFDVNDKLICIAKDSDIFAPDEIVVIEDINDCSFGTGYKFEGYRSYYDLQFVLKNFNRFKEEFND